MATFVATLEHELALSHVRPVERDLRFATLLVSALTLLALAIHGYHPYAEDGGLYLAGVKRLLNPALYPQVTAFVLEPMRFSLFAPLISMIAAKVGQGHLSLPLVLLTFHLATIWASLFAAWLLASRCWTTRAACAGAVVLLSCWLALPVAGTALVLMDPYLTARSISTPCMILALVAALDLTEPNGTEHIAANPRRRRARLLWLASIALAAAMHPLMAAYALGATLMLASVRSANLRTRVWRTAALSAAALATAFLLQQTAWPESPAYLAVALTRAYWFPAAWSWYELVGLAAPLAILALVASKSSLPAQAPAARRALAKMAVSAGATAWLIAMLFARAAAPTHLVARVQPLRVFQIVYLVLVLMLGAKLGESTLRRSIWRWAGAILLLGGIMLAAERHQFSNSNHLELPWSAPRNPWVKAFLWIRDNTPNDALFALDADYINAPGEDAQCFRAIAERSSLPDYSKDGGEASIAPELTGAWSVGQQAQRGLNAPSSTDVLRLAALTPLGVSWILLDTPTATRFDCPYQSAAVKVCRLRR